MALAIDAGDIAPLGRAASVRDFVAARVGEARDPIVRLTRVSKRFGTMAAVDDVSFSVAPGEILGIIGRSGAGKSTLIRCLNGLERPESGAVEILGQTLATMSEPSLRRQRGRIGMIFQHFNLLSAKTAAENVALPLKIARVPRPRRAARVRELLNLVGLAAKTDTYPAQLSGGQKQRVGIARALAGEPALLLSDEATSALDPETTASILDLLRDINRSLGLTIVMITHEMSVIRAIAHRVIVLDAGRIVEEGPTPAVFSSPASALTRGLIGSAVPSAAAEPACSLDAAYRPGHHAIIRIGARGDAALNPLVGLVQGATGAEPLILRATLDRVGPDPVATMILAIPNGDPARLLAVERALRASFSTLDILGYAHDPV